MRTATISAGPHPPRAESRYLVGLVVIVLVCCAVWANFASRPAREHAQEYQWLAAHGKHENAPVVELGWQDSTGAARTVFVTASNGVQAFVELEGSRVRVTDTGPTIPVVLDLRDASAVGTGAAPDLLDRSFTADYARAVLAPSLLALAASAALGIRTIRRRRRS